MRRQRRRQVLWVHRYSLINEMLVVAANEYLSRRANHFERKMGLRYDAVLLSTADSGGFLEISCEPPFWDGRTETSTAQASCQVLDDLGDSFVLRCVMRSEESVDAPSEHILPVDLMCKCDEQLARLLEGMP
jgi:hypothetical protein